MYIVGMNISIEMYSAIPTRRYFVVQLNNLLAGLRYRPHEFVWLRLNMWTEISFHLSH